MISVAEAKQLLQQNVTALFPSTVALNDAVGKVLAEDVIAPIDLPPFPQSSMDGYAFAFDQEYATPLVLNGEVPAGKYNAQGLPTGTAVRIFTGAPVPPGADTVLMQEKAMVREGLLYVTDETLQKGANVRVQGSEILKGTLALRQGQVLSPAALAFISAMGLPTVRVIPDPIIAVIVTGDELQQPGQSLVPGQVYESNSVALKAALASSHFKLDFIYRCPDKPESISEAITTAVAKCDVVILTGGVSVGDYDFVVKAASGCGVTQVFHKIKQRPGKPIYFGKKNEKLVFGLPGNPSSVLSCYYQLVLPALGLLTTRNTTLKQLSVPVSGDYSKSAALTFFLKGFYDGHSVTILDAQESYKLSSFARANCMVQIDEVTTFCKAGEPVQIHLLPL